MADKRKGPTVWDNVLVWGTLVIVAGAILVTMFVKVS